MKERFAYRIKGNRKRGLLGIVVFLFAVVCLFGGLVACSSLDKGTSKDAGLVSNSENDLSDIKTKLNKADIYGITVSSDEGFVAYIQGDPELLEGQLYLWQVGSSDPQIIPGVNDRICELFWSPNSSYLFVDIGTAAQREGIIVNAREEKSMGELGYTGGPCWSPDSNWIAVGMVNSNIQAVTPTELNGVQDLVLYNIHTQEKKVIAKATSEYDFVPRQWSEGNLTYDKYYYNSQKMEKLSWDHF